MKESSIYEESLDGSQKSLTPTRIEYLYPHVDHLVSTRFINQKYLTPEMKSTLFMAKNDLFPSNERLYKFGKISSNMCNSCRGLDNHGHIFICNRYSTIFDPMISTLKEYDPNISMLKMVNMEISDCCDWSLPCAWILALSIEYIWKQRRLNKKIETQMLVGVLLGHLKISENESVLSNSCNIFYNMLVKMYKV